MPLPSFLESLNCASSKSSRTTRKKSKKNSMKKSNADLTKSGPSAPSNDHDAHDPKIASTESLYDEEFESFWDIGKYKIALKRCDNGQKLGTEIADLISERAKLEDQYGKSIKQWTSKWSNYLSSESKEYETTKEAWFAFLEAGNKTADIHLELSKHLINSPVYKIKDWLKRKYQKHIINYKQTREFEENFKEAQANWVTLNDKLAKSKKEYIEAIENTKNCQQTYKSAETNPKFTPEQLQKMNQKTERAKEEQMRTCDKYKECIIELDLYRPRYIENMTEAFNKTQHFEQERMLFFKQIFLECHEILQVHSDERFDQLFVELCQKINKMNPQHDLDWWSQKYALGTKPNWPEFEELEDD